MLIAFTSTGIPMPDCGTLSGMVERTMSSVTYSDAVPTFAVCSVCRKVFRTLPAALADAEKATREFYLAFEKHQCDENAREATEE